MKKYDKEMNPPKYGAWRKCNGYETHEMQVESYDSMRTIVINCPSNMRWEIFDNLKTKIKKLVNEH